jgi:SRSO17 transposase
MTVDQILELEKPLEEYLSEFADCFGRSEPRENLAHYVRGQLSNLPRKSAEPMAEHSGVAPRTLQAFLSWRDWPAGHLKKRLQKIVARDHQDRQAIGLVDDSAHVKSGPETAGMQRQYCGRLGKVENCVVTVHLGYSTYDLKFRALLDGEVYLPQAGWDDPQRRQRAGIPQAVSYRPKWQIALEQIRRARQNGVKLQWIVADEDYGCKPGFREGIAALKLWYVVEVPKRTYGWTYWPGPRPQGSPSTVENLVRFAAKLRDQPWQRRVVKETHQGPVVWQTKVCRIWQRKGKASTGSFWLIVARQVVSGEEKYFLSNAPQRMAVRRLLHVAFARHGIEKAFQEEKSELGLSHFEVRKWDAIHRHLAVTQVSHLFLMRQTNQLRGEKSADHSGTSAPRGRRLNRDEPLADTASSRVAGTLSATTPAATATQPASPHLPHQDPPGSTRPTGHQPPPPT